MALVESILQGIVETAEQNEWVGMLVTSIVTMADVFAEMRWNFVYFERPPRGVREVTLTARLVDAGGEPLGVVALPLALR